MHVNLKKNEVRGSGILGGGQMALGGGSCPPQQAQTASLGEVRERVEL